MEPRSLGYEFHKRRQRDPPMLYPYLPLQFFLYHCAMPYARI